MLTLTTWLLLAGAPLTIAALRVVLGLKAIGALKGLATLLGPRNSERTVVAIGELIAQIASGPGRHWPRRAERSKELPDTRHPDTDSDT